MKKGFTLIEMLGIITVLAILLLVTFPNLSKSLKQTKETKNNNFTNNLKISAEAYIELNRDNFPELDEGGSTTITIQDLYDANLLKGQYEGIDTTNKIIITKNIDNTLDYIYVNPNNIIEYTFNYTGGEQTFTIPQDGLYKIETWGAQGGNYASDSVGGFGGYSTGVVNLIDNDVLYINVGGQGAGKLNTEGCIGSPSGSCSGGYNGGGDSYYLNNEMWAAGGGATHIALKSGLLSSLDNDIDKILVVSGGGGGSYSGAYKGGGTAGGYVANNGIYRNGFVQSIGGNQSVGGSGLQSGSFGIGGSITTSNGTGGGAGLYGAGSGSASSAGGGSSYIGNPLLTDKSMYCYGCEESNETSTFTVSTTGTSTLKDITNCPNGYSENPIAKCAKAGNGYAKITYLGNSI